MFARAWPGRRIVAALLVITCLFLSPLLIDPAGAADEPSFVDSTATIINPPQIHLGGLVFVGPFAVLKAGPDAQHGITIGHESNVQDSVVVDATGGAIHLGEQVILAHGSRVKGPAALGETGTCPGGAAVKVCPAFVSFNAEVDGGTIEKDAIVSALARVGPGVTIPSGRKVLPGKNVTTNAEVASKTAAVTEADRLFMAGVIEVNVNFAKGYATLLAEDPTNARGVNYDAGPTATNPVRDLPHFAGKETRDPLFRNRIIGDVSFAQTLAAVGAVMGSRDSLRADEGEEWVVGSIAGMRDSVTWHALEDSHLHLGNEGNYGTHSIVHGGPTPFGDSTITGTNLRLGDRAVFYRSRVGDNVTIGASSLVQESDLPTGTTIPPRVIIIAGQESGKVEWEAAPDEPLPSTMPGLPSTGGGYQAVSGETSGSAFAIRWQVALALLALALPLLVILRPTRRQQQTSTIRTTGR